MHSSLLFIRYLLKLRLKATNSFSGKCHAFSIVTMWEETYLRSNQMGGILSAYQNIAYRLPSISVVDIISRRLEFVVSDIEGRGLARELIPNPDHAGDVAEFLWLVRKSVLNDERRARHFLESIALGNLRKAMELFSAFLVSGHPDTGKILNTFRTQHGYLIPLHEFIKSISLGDNRYYSGELSQVVNLFSISDESRPSHFTKFRVLEYLFFHRNRSTTYGLGFIPTDIVRKEFLKFGTSDQDITESLRILSAYLLVENDLYERSAAGNAYRITQAGRYYLSNKFSYLDLVCQDTPISDRATYDLIKELVARTELGDRFTRVTAFVRYLVGEEEREHAAILNASDSMPLRGKLMPGLEKGFENDHQYILKQRRRGRKMETEKTPYAPKG